MPTSFYFYDVETSGFNPRADRIMQFAGQRTDKNFKPVGKPDNILVKLTPDILPEPGAILTHGISPQKSIAEGVSEANFLSWFNREAVRPNTIFVGFNNIRFDDEFMRFGLWRNFYDAYEWQWKNSCSRWDLQDVVRMTRALRPDGIMWPNQDAQNRLEVLARINKLEHTTAHDAQSDVTALIDLTKLIFTKQPKLFNYLLSLRRKGRVEPFVKSGKPFVYTSGRYPKETLHTAVAVVVADHPQKQSVLVYDLRIDPTVFLKMSASELASLAQYKSWKSEKDRPPYFPVKELALNRCPAVAPLSVLDKASRQRLKLDMTVTESNLKKLQQDKDFGQRLTDAWQKLYPQTERLTKLDDLTVDNRLYDGFVDNTDRIKMRAVRAARPNDLADFAEGFTDERLRLLLPLYKARNYPDDLTSEEQTYWEGFCRRKLLDGGTDSCVTRFFKRLFELESTPKQTKQQKYLLEELSLYGQSNVPLE